MLNPEQFYKGSFNYRLCANGPVNTVPRYSYESAAKLYDVIDLEGVRYLRLNGFPSELTPVHKAILAHFNLQ